ncbi:MAG: hypothetical protein ABW298_07585 [Candidatus Binatia bacterium]|jgi:hypothetical protein
MLVSSLPAPWWLPVAIASVALLAAGCAPRPDPRVQAAEDFRSTVFDLIAQDESQTKRLNALRLGMSDQEVLEAAGAPATRESRMTASGGGAETWIYSGQLSTLGTLTFENGRLVQIQTY